MESIVLVGKSLLGYRGGPNQWAWAIHRIAGLGVLLFLSLHIIDIFIVAFGPAAFNNLLFLYKGPFARLLEIFLAFGLLYHALNGLRIIAADFFPRLASLNTARRLFNIELVLFAGLFFPSGYFMMWTLPQEPFHHNVIIATTTTLAIMALPVVIVFAARLPALVPALSGNLGEIDYSGAFDRILQGRSHQTGSKTELNIWLFMRVSGLLLVVLALFHMFWLHFVINVEDITFNTIVQRWNDPNNPLVSMLWRTYDLGLLVFAFTHGILGANYSLGDYIHRSAVRRFLQIGLLVFWAALILMGAGIIFYFRGTFA